MNSKPLLVRFRQAWNEVRSSECDKKAVRCEKRKMKRDEKLWEGKE